MSLGDQCFPKMDIGFNGAKVASNGDTKAKQFNLTDISDNNIKSIKFNDSVEPTFDHNILEVETNIDENGDKSIHSILSKSCNYCNSNIEHPKLKNGIYECGYKPYTCKMCNYSTNAKGNLNIHNKSDKHFYKLSEMNPTSRSLDTSVNKIKNEPVLPTINCSIIETCQKNDLLSTETLENSVFDINENGIVTCNICNFVAKDVKSFTQHASTMGHLQKFSTIHAITKLKKNDEKNLACLENVKDRRGISRVRMFHNDANIQIVENFIVQPPQDGIYRCMVCFKYKTNYFRLLIDHIMEFSCNTENVAFNSQIVTISDKNYLCLLCNYKSSLRANFYLHCDTDKHKYRSNVFKHIIDSGLKYKNLTTNLNLSQIMTVKCIPCNVQFISLNLLSHHIMKPAHRKNVALFSFILKMNATCDSTCKFKDQNIDSILNKMIVNNSTFTYACLVKFFSVFEYKNTNFTFSCSTCEYESNRAENLMNHFNTVPHEGRIDFLNVICFKNDLNNDDLKDDIFENEKNNDTSTFVLKLYACPLCFHQFEKEKLARHLISDHNVAESSIEQIISLSGCIEDKPDKNEIAIFEDDVVDNYEWEDVPAAVFALDTMSYLVKDVFFPVEMFVTYLYPDICSKESNWVHVLQDNDATFGCRECMACFKNSTIFNRHVGYHMYLKLQRFKMNQDSDFQEYMKGFQWVFASCLIFGFISNVQMDTLMNLYHLKALNEECYESVYREKLDSLNSNEFVSCDATFVDNVMYGEDDQFTDLYNEEREKSLMNGRNYDTNNNCKYKCHRCRVGFLKQSDLEYHNKCIMHQIRKNCQICQICNLNSDIMCKNVHGNFTIGQIVSFHLLSKLHKQNVDSVLSNCSNDDYQTNDFNFCHICDKICFDVRELQEHVGTVHHRKLFCRQMSKMGYGTILTELDDFYKDSYPTNVVESFVKLFLEFRGKIQKDDHKEENLSKNDVTSLSKAIETDNRYLCISKVNDNHGNVKDETIKISKYYFGRTIKNDILKDVAMEAILTGLNNDAVKVPTRYFIGNTYKCLDCQLNFSGEGVLLKHFENFHNFKLPTKSVQTIALQLVKNLTERRKRDLHANETKILENKLANGNKKLKMDTCLALKKVEDIPASVKEAYMKFVLGHVINGNGDSKENVNESATLLQPLDFSVKEKEPQDSNLNFNPFIQNATNTQINQHLLRTLNTHLSIQINQSKKEANFFEFALPTENKLTARKSRTRINDEQLTVLKNHFVISSSPSYDEIEKIAKVTKLPTRAVKHWFRNTLFKERQKNKESPYNFNNPPSTHIDIDQYEKTGKVVSMICPSYKGAINLDNGRHVSNDRVTEKMECKDDNYIQPKQANEDDSRVCNSGPPMFKISAEAGSIALNIPDITRVNLLNDSRYCRRANRTRFSDHQVGILKKYFNTNCYPKDGDIEQLSSKLKLESRVIIVWFQNMRQKSRRSSAVSTDKEGGTTCNDINTVNENAIENVDNVIMDHSKNSIKDCANEMVCYSREIKNENCLYSCHKCGQGMDDYKKWCEHVITCTEESSPVDEIKPAFHSINSIMNNCNIDTGSKRPIQFCPVTSNEPNVTNNDSINSNDSKTTLCKDNFGHKRVRTTLSSSQYECLISEFNKNPNPDRFMIEKISRRTGLKIRVIQVWFQNNRARERKTAKSNVMHSCTICNSSFINSNDVFNHMVKFHNVTSWSNTPISYTNIPRVATNDIKPSTSIIKSSVFKSYNCIYNDINGGSNTNSTGEDNTIKKPMEIAMNLASPSYLNTPLDLTCNKKSLGMKIASLTSEKKTVKTTNVQNTKKDIKTVFHMAIPKSTSSCLVAMDELNGTSVENPQSLVLKFNKEFSKNYDDSLYTNNGSTDASQCSKRFRTHMGTGQVFVMKAIFNLNKNPNSTECFQLGIEISLNKRVIQVWFQNARAKSRKFYQNGNLNIIPRKNNSSWCSNDPRDKEKVAMYAKGYCIDCSKLLGKETGGISHLFTKEHIDCIKTQYYQKRTV